MAILHGLIYSWIFVSTLAGKTMFLTLKTYFDSRTLFIYLMKIHLIQIVWTLLLNYSNESEFIYWKHYNWLRMKTLQLVTNENTTIGYEWKHYNWLRIKLLIVYLHLNIVRVKMGYTFSISLKVLYTPCLKQSISASHITSHTYRSVNMLYYKKTFNEVIK